METSELKIMLPCTGLSGGQITTVESYQKNPAPDH
jgi:hypothetical protein